MSEFVTINPEPSSNPALDFAALKEEGLRLLQQLAGDIWTDYNEHDPGITTLEQLCYALTELSYRAEFPLADLLTDKPGGRIDAHRQALFVPQRILPCNPVTEKDYRKLLIDRVPQVANVWLKPYTSEKTQGLDGLYEMGIYAPGADDCATDARAPSEIIQAVRRVYSAHRGLCEDLQDIHLLKPVTATVLAHVNIEDTRAPEALLARLLFQLGNFLAPEPRRVPLHRLLEAGKTPEEIFEGPLLLQGFIPDDQLQPKAGKIPVRELIRVMARSPGVTSVSDVSVSVRDSTYDSAATLDIQPGEILQLETRPTPKPGFSIQLFRNGLRVQPNPTRVRHELDRLWADHRRTYALGPQYEEYLRLPEGRYHDLQKYFSIQNQYPNVYGISASGLPEGATRPRRGQARQFKGYLLVFEQLLADFLAQLANVKELYSIEPGTLHTYFYQSLSGAVPDVEPLLKEGRGEAPSVGYERGLRLLVESQDPVIERRNRFLDFLLALYGESLDADSLVPLGEDEGSGRMLGERLIRAKLALLQHLVESTHGRNRGIDYLSHDSRDDVAGMTIKSRIQLGMNVFNPRPLIDLLDEQALELAETEGRGAGASRGSARHDELIAAHFTPVPPPTEEQKQAGGAGAPLLRAQTITEDFLFAAGSLENFRVGSLPGENTVSVVCKAGSGDGWLLAGKFPDWERAVARVHALVGVARGLKHGGQQLYIVEHILLRPRDDGFTATAVLSTSSAQGKDTEYQRFAREVLRRNAPSHVRLEYCFLSPGKMVRFERLYWMWRRALRSQEEPALIETSNALREFLRSYQSQEAA